MSTLLRALRVAALSLALTGAVALAGAAPAHADRNYPPPTAGTTYLWATNSGTNPSHTRCVEVGGWRTDDFAQVNQYRCHWGANQQWRLNYSNGSYYLVNVNSGKCLEVLGWGVNYGDPIVQYSCHLGNNQRWQLIWHEQVGLASFRNVHSGLCLSVDGMYTDDFRRFVQNTCYPFTNQRFEPMYVAG